MFCRLCIFLAFFFTFSLSLRAQSRPAVITLAEELRSFTDISRLPRYVEGAVAGQVSTYDTTGGNEDGFNGVYSFVRRNPDSTLVLADLAGPGVVNRIWTPTPTADTLDFYIDDTLRPAFSICYLDLFSGKVFPFASPLCGNQLGGYYCYFPILFQRHFKLVCRAKTTQFHQIQYRRFAPETKVASFSDAGIRSVESVLRGMGGDWEPGTRLSKRPGVQQLKPLFTLAPGQRKTLATIDGGGRIESIELSPASAFEGLSKDIDIRISWDDDRVPAIECPVADFFGFGFGRPAMQSLLLGVKNNTCYSYFPMPFDKKAKIELVYRKATDDQQPVALSAHIQYERQPRDPVHEGRFYTQWNQRGTTPQQPVDILTANGRGHYVGTILQAQGMQPGITIFFEGDDSTVIDGRMALHGTGSEDYFNGGWYALKDRWDASFSLPLHGCLDYSTVFGRTGGYRFYLNDKLPFSKSIYHSIEHGPSDNETPAIYTTLGLYYGDRPPVRHVLPELKNTGVFIPDTLVLLPQFTHFSPGVDVAATLVEDTSYDGGYPLDVRIDGHGDLTFYPDQLPEGAYQLQIDYLEESNGPEFAVWQRQSRLSEWTSASADKSKWIRSKEISNIHIGRQNASITIQLQGDEDHWHFRLGRLLLVRRHQTPLSK